MSDYSRDRFPDTPPSMVAAIGESVNDAAHNVLAAGLRLLGAVGEAAVHQIVPNPASQPSVERYPGNIVA
jgi:hypothetical protein